jgi:hypothetical protein
MAVSHLELLVEEPSMEAFLRALLPRLLPQNRTFEVHPFQDKNDLLGNLDARLRAYVAWLPEDWRIVVVLDRDDDDCRALKRRLESIAKRAGLRTRRASAAGPWQIVNRIAIEELESWYFGEWEGVRMAYPRVATTVPKRSKYRDPDAIAGGTWEAFERVLQEYGYFKGGLEKIEAARRIGACLTAERCRSKSFQIFHNALIEALA